MVWDLVNSSAQLRSARVAGAQGSLFASRHRLVWSRTHGSHPCNPGSNPGDGVGNKKLTLVNMDIFIIVMLVAVFVAILASIFWSGRRKSSDDEMRQQTLLIANEVSRLMDTRFIESVKLMQNQASEISQGMHSIIKDVTTELTKVGEGQKQVFDVAKQLENLSDILKNPKQRGVLGEYYLKTVLENVLPPNSFALQYEFNDGTKVDAAIFVKDRIIPVDSKFSLENYNRLLETKDGVERERLESAFREDLKTRIDETSKYIKPGEGTMEFAFMFIPSEAVYYDLLVNKIGSMKSNTRDLIQYAAGDKKVMIVSPTTFLAYLQTVLQGLKAFQIEESAKEIRKRVEELGRHLIGYEIYMKKLGAHLGTTVGMYNSAYKEFGKIDKDVLKISGRGVQAELIELPKPDTDA